MYDIGLEIDVCRIKARRAFTTIAPGATWGEDVATPNPGGVKYEMCRSSASSKRCLAREVHVVIRDAELVDEVERFKDLRFKIQY